MQQLIFSTCVLLFYVPVLFLMILKRVAFLLYYVDISSPPQICKVTSLSEELFYRQFSNSGNASFNYCDKDYIPLTGSHCICHLPTIQKYLEAIYLDIGIKSVMLSIGVKNQTHYKNKK